MIEGGQPPDALFLSIAAFFFRSIANQANTDSAECSSNKSGGNGDECLALAGNLRLIEVRRGCITLKMDGMTYDHETTN
jgi:hypothetical protein